MVNGSAIVNPLISTNKVPAVILVCAVLVLDALPKAVTLFILTTPPLIVVIPE